MGDGGMLGGVTVRNPFVGDRLQAEVTASCPDWSLRVAL